MNMKINISSILSRMNCLAKATIVLSLSSFLMLQSCGDSDLTQKEEEKEDNKTTGNVTMDLRAVRPVIINNSLLYVFDSKTNFVERKLNITTAGDMLSMSMPVNTATNANWNLVLVSCDRAINGNGDNNIKQPTVAEKRMAYAPMWTTGLILPENKYMEQTPAELRYALVKGNPTVVIKKNETTNATAELTRNVAKIQVILKEHAGFDPVVTASKHAYAELHDVPNTLTWGGRLWPNKETPQLSPKPMREYLNFKSEKADTLNFVVPADRGSGLMGDTTKHKIKLKLSMPITVNGVQKDYYGKSADNNGDAAFSIPHVPKANGIIQVIVNKFTGEPATALDIKVSVKDWKTIKDQEEDF